MNLVDEKTTVADIYLDVSEPFYTVPQKNPKKQQKKTPSKMNLFWMATPDRTQAEEQTKGNDKGKPTDSESI